MKKIEFTYGQLDRVLRGFGFTRREFERRGPGVRYEHKETGAAISLPLFPDQDRVYEHHYIAVRGMLDNFGVADRSVFEAKLKKVG